MLPKSQWCTFFEVCDEANEELVKCTGGSDTQPACCEDIGPGQDAFLEAVYCPEYRKFRSQATGANLDEGPTWHE